MVRESLTVAYRACGGGGARVRGEFRALRLVRVNVVYSRGGARGRRVTELAFVAGSGSERRLIAVWVLIRQCCVVALSTTETLLMSDTYPWQGCEQMRVDLVHRLVLVAVSSR